MEQFHGTNLFISHSPGQLWSSHLERGVKALESPSLPTLGARGRLGKGYFYLWSEEPFPPLSSCQVVFVGGPDNVLKTFTFSKLPPGAW